MISAADAYTLADNCRNERIEKAWEELEKLIQSKAEKGYFDCCFYGYITQEIIRRLESLGYKVEVEDHFEDRSIYIDWAKEEEVEVKIKPQYKDFEDWLIKNY